MIDVATFRKSFPAFSDVSKYPDTSIAFWVSVASIMLPTQTWGLGSTAAQSPPTTQMDIGLSLFVAHNLSLEAQALQAAAAGGSPGSAVKGPISSESVGGVSRSYDTTAGLNLDAGPWNLTTYGTRFVFMARLVGKGPVQIGVDCGPTIYPWFGPPVGPNGLW